MKFRVWFSILLIQAVKSSKVIDGNSYCPFDSSGVEFECIGARLESTIVETLIDLNRTSSISDVFIDETEPAEEFQEIGKFLERFVNLVPSSACRRDLRIFLKALDNSSLWAVQMLDATAKMPTGLITANTFQFGDYDECVKIHAGSVLGKYCLSDITFSPSKRKYPPFYRKNLENPFSLHYDPHKSVWEKFILTEDPSKKRRDMFHSGVCIPHTCNANDVQLLLNNILAIPGSQYGFQFNVSVSEQSCDTSESKPYRIGAKILGCVILLFIMAVLVSTLWDLCRTRNGSKELKGVQSLMESFSIMKSLSNLSRPDASDEMDVFHGMKALSIMLIMMGHRCVSSYGGPFFNPEFLEERYRQFTDMLLLNGTLIVDTFFLIGGYMTFLGVFREYEAKKKVKATQVYFYRWLRITPVYMLIVFFYGYILEHLGDGPIWNKRVGREAERCRDNWWTNFFYINNYVHSDRLCMFQSWYVTCDLHFTLIAPLIAHLLARSPRKGIMVLSTLIFVSIIIPFITTLTNRYDGVMRVYMSIFEDLPSNFMFSQVYIRTHNRAIPYVIGIAGAYIYTRLQKSNYIFSMRQIFLFGFLSSVFALGSICGAWIFYIPGRPYNVMENALYAALHRVFWAISMVWLPIGGGQKAFGIIQPTLSSKMFVPLSRLCFGAFLVHGAVQLFTTMSMRAPEWMSFPKLFWMTSGDIMITFFFALLLHIFFEAPIGALQKRLFSKSKIKNEPTQKAHQKSKVEEKEEKIEQTEK